MARVRLPAPRRSECRGPALRGGLRTGPGFFLLIFELSFLVSQASALLGADESRRRWVSRRGWVRARLGRADTLVPSREEF